MKIQFSKLIISSFIAATALSGCRDEVDLPAHHSGSLADGVVTLDYKVDGDMPEGRSITASPHECDLDHAYILFFDDTPGDHQYKDYRRMDVNIAGKVKFDIPVALEENHSYRTMIVGNADAYNPAPDSYASFGAYIEDVAPGRTIEQMQTLLAALHSGPIIKGSPSRLPMWGRLIDGSGTEIPFRYTKNDIEYLVEGSLWFSRALSRLDLLNLVPGTLDIRYVKVCNYQPRGLFFEDWLPNTYQPVTLDRASDAPAGDGSDGYVAMPEGDAVQELTARLYAFQNIVSNVILNDRKTTCLIIAGYYTDPQSGVKDESMTYYRLNMANLSESQLLKRNHVYRAVIKGVLGRGSDTDKEAYERSTPVFDTSVDSDWETGGDNTSTDKDGNFLIVSRTQLTFQGANPSAAELHVFTSPGLVWTIEPVTDQEGNSPEKYAWEKIDDTSLKIGPTGINDGDGALFGYFDVVATHPTTGARLSVRLNLQQLSSKAETIALSVDGRMGTLEIDWPGNGATRTFTVRTGSEAAQWRVTAPLADNPDFAEILTKVSFTTAGGDNSPLNVRIPAFLNLDKEAKRVLTLKVEYGGNDALPAEERIAPVTLRITQTASDHWISIDNTRTNGALEIDAFSTSAMYPNGLGAIVPLSISLADQSMKYMVTSDLNTGRDLFIANRKYDMTYSCDQTSTSGNDPNMMRVTGLEVGSVCYVHAYRTGPGDLDIEGVITVTAYRAGEDPDKVEINNVNSMSVTVRVKTPDAVLDDVVLDSKSNGSGIRFPEGYYVVADRYAGNPTKMQEPVAPFYSPVQTLTIGGMKMDGLDSRDPLRDIRRKFYDSNWAMNLSNCHEADTRWTDPYRGVSGAPYFYTAGRLDGWKASFSNNQEINGFYNLIKDHVRYSKGRAFLISDFDSYADGKRRYVCCWLPQPDQSDWVFLNVYSGATVTNCISVNTVSGHALNPPVSTSTLQSAQNNGKPVARGYRPSTNAEVREYVTGVLKNTVQSVRADTD